MRGPLTAIAIVLATAVLAVAMKCPRCGHEAEDSAKFCSQCGNRLTAKSNLLVNGDFTKDLAGWRVYDACFDDPGADYTAGTIDWTPEHGGAAKVVVSGAPATITLQQHFRRFVPKGSRIVFEVSKPADNKSGWYAFVGGLNVKTLLNEEETRGKDSVSVVTDQAYFRGTPLLLHFTVWPGTSTFYVRSVRVVLP